MLKEIFNDDSQNRALVFNTDDSRLFWQKYNNEDIDLLEVRFLQQFFDKKNNDVELKVPEDVRIVKCNPNGKYIKKNINSKVAYLYESAKEIGLMFISVSNKEIDTLNKNGGIVILAKIDNLFNVVFIMPYMKVMEKIVRNNSISKSIYHSITNNNENHEQQMLFTDDERAKILNDRKEVLRKQEENFYEATIRIPKDINAYEMDRLVQTNHKILNLVQELYVDTKNKLNYNSHQINQLIEENRFYKNQEETIKRLEYELNRSHKTIDNLHNEKNILQMENEKSVQVAFNRLKSKLDRSKTAIERNIDLNDDSNIYKSIDEIIQSIFSKAGVTNARKKEIANDKDIQSLIQNVCDNFTTKVQSLLDIKSNLEELEILEKGTDV
ncbi:hypothetical protein [Paenibacillus lautus]|uniref:hypothetical protein n=1 Tax=Paenibacillus lautus TaxID=1401 RepID=UPI001C7DFC80|nr:hypothetical protein [Paenibacillus lautus]MBX4150749.1 hypothetical protein [Paenibacillus lautus]